MNDPVLFWNDVLLEASRRDFTPEFIKNPQHGGPTRTSRAMAMVHLAIHDAYFGIEGSNPTYLSKKGVTLPAVNSAASVNAAISAAALIVLNGLYPAFSSFFTQKAAEFEIHGNATRINEGHKFGTDVGLAILALRKNDQSAGEMPYAPSSAYGKHREDPFAPGQGYLTPWWGGVSRFTNAGHASLDAPPGHTHADYLQNPDYLRDYIEVVGKGVHMGGTRTPEETAIGLYWGYDGANKLGVPPRLYNQIARMIVQKASPAHTVKDNVRLFAMINVAMADAGIDAWHWKYEYNLWRPVVGIREAAKSMGPSGNPDRTATATADATAPGDPFWAPLGAPQTNPPPDKPGSFYKTPGFPAYPSGHATFGAAMFQALQLFKGKTAITLQQVIDHEDSMKRPGDEPGLEFDFTSEELDGKSIDPNGSVRPKHERKFTNYIAPIWENSISRVFLGVHWRFDGLPRTDHPNKMIGGVELGLAIGEETFAFFNPTASAASPAKKRKGGKA